MQIFRGVPASPGIAVGEGVLVRRPEVDRTPKAITDSEAEVARFLAARDVALSELEGLHAQALEILGEEEAEIFQIDAMMLEDEDFEQAIAKAIRTNKVNAEYALRRTAEEFSAMLAATGDDYIAGRGADVLDVSERVVAVLAGASVDLPALEAPSVLAAEDLLPSETLRLDRVRLLAVVTAKGTANSHTAILARSMGIPAVAGLGTEAIESLGGRTLIVDGESGQVYVDPDAATAERYARLMAAEDAAKEELRALVGTETRTAAGRRIELYANVGSLEDIDEALRNDAEGIGLFRTEFSYLGRRDYPTEEELFRLYREAARRMGSRKVIIRTIDIGADKAADYFRLEAEENPALGLRGIRLCLARPELFKTQLRAILRAATGGNIALMYPMVSAAEEIDAAKALLEEARAELRAAGVPCAERLEQGIMVETPAAALMSDVLAEKCDFFSIGSNDLTQYTLAADRQNPALAASVFEAREAVLKLIELTARNGHGAGIWVGICGELGADAALTERFLAMGLDEFSVSPSRLLDLRRRIMESGDGRD